MEAYQENENYLIAKQQKRENRAASAVKIIRYRTAFAYCSMLRCQEREALEKTIIPDNDTVCEHHKNITWSFSFICGQAGTPGSGLLVKNMDDIDIALAF